MRFDRVCFIVMLLVISGSPESRTQRDPVISRLGQPALDYRVPTSLPASSCCRIRVTHPEQRRRGRRPDTPSLRSGMCHPPPTSVSIESGWQDSNLRLRAPKARGFAATLHPVVVGMAVELPPQNMSERADLNRRSPGPRPGAIPRLRYVLFSVTRAGVEPALPP